MKKEASLEISKKRAEAALNEANAKIEELGTHSSCLHDALAAVQNRFATIRNIPEEQRLEYENIKQIRLSWKQQAEKIERDYNIAQVKAAGGGAAVAGAGVAVVALGPTAAMGIATTFGVASTGTAISALSGAAATNAALAWLGGGALAAGGGGMAAGNALLALAGPVGWAIAGIALLGSGLLIFKGRTKKKRLESVFELVSMRDARFYELAAVELEERIKRMDDERVKLEDATRKIDSFGLDYSVMSEAQQYELGAYVNLMNASTQLLVNPILGLQPKYTEEDLDKFVCSGAIRIDEKKRSLILYLCNLLYRIELDDKDRKLLRKIFRKNKELLNRFGLKKADFDDTVMEIIKRALVWKYQNAGTICREGVDAALISETK